MLGQEMAFGYGYTGEDGKKVGAIRDMLDGGGAGRYGDTFGGSDGGNMITGLLNGLGVRPMGYSDRQADKTRTAVSGLLDAMSQPRARPQARPASQPVYSGRGDYGMPQPNFPLMQPTAPRAAPSVPFGGYGFQYTPQPAMPPQYSGRGAGYEVVPPAVYGPMMQTADPAALLDQYMRVRGY